MPSALITGNAGFVGWHFERYLREAGWYVVGMDINGANRIDAREGFRVYESANVDLLIHCAAIVGGRAMIDGSPLALAPNLELDSAMFQWALKNRPKRILYFSSSAVYPVYDQNTYKRSLKENRVRPSLDAPSVGTPDSLYGWAKLTGENLAHRARQAGLNVSVVRPFSGYGANQSPDYPFRALLERAMRKDDPFEIWGDGTQTRDWIHISDIVNACMRMYSRGIDGPVNLGTGRATPFLRLAEMMCDAVSYSPDFHFNLTKPTGVQYRVADVTHLHDFYQPEITLETGIQGALEYWRR